MSDCNTSSEIVSAFKNAKTAIVSAHVSPDADAIGSSAALVYLLQQLGLEVTWYLKDAIPSKFKPLVGDLVVTNVVPKTKVDLIVVSDTATNVRVGADYKELYALGSSVINIDHHVSNCGWGDLNLIDSVAASSTLIIFDLFRETNIKIPSNIANLLLAGLMDDTGNFRYSNVNARALQTAAQLVEDGASPVTISNELYFSASYASVKLRASALSAITLEHGGKIGFLSLPVDVLKESGANESDSEGLVDEVRSIVGTVAGIFMRELESNRWKLSLRSKDPKIDVNKVAGHFSGGGHAAAAGCTILGSEAEVKSKILAQMAHEVDSSI